VKIAIFGATSAIAENVARLYAAEGAELFLAGRGVERLDSIALDLKVRGAQSVDVAEVDFNDIASLERVVGLAGEFDVCLVAYGSLPSQEAVERNPQLAPESLHTNFVSPVTLLLFLADKLRSGCAVAVITSVAGDRGRRSNYLYGAAKGGLSRFLEGFAHRMAQKRVQIVDIRPGLVDTPMTDGFDKSGLLWTTSERVAADIKRALDRRQGVVYTPWFWQVAMAIIRRIPRRLFHRTSL
jgi:decaprenylphospho-beta-D-erythro-pentofuranosid-2-ulose 2-reductase